jgi:hypothetical protein
VFTSISRHLGPYSRQKSRGWSVSSCTLRHPYTQQVSSLQSSPTSAMIVQSGRVVVRLPQLSLQCLGSRRLGFANTQRAAALYNTLDLRKSIGFANNDSLLTSIIRTYATAKPVSRPKAHTGRTTTAARKAPTTSKTKAAKKPAVKKTAPKAIPKTKSTAKPRATLTAKPRAKSTAKPKAKPKAKPRIKPKPTSAKKAKAKPKPKRQKLTPVEKRDNLIKELKKAALKPPHGTSSTAWTVFNGETVKSKSGELKAGRGAFAQTIKDAAAGFKNLSPERLEVLPCPSSQTSTDLIALQSHCQSEQGSKCYSVSPMDRIAHPHGHLPSQPCASKSQTPKRERLSVQAPGS